MAALTTDGVMVSVESFFQEEHSNHSRNEFMFSYHITIENQNYFPVQLVKRKWYVMDSTGTINVIEGDGVVGRQPMLGFEQRHHYVSGICLTSEMGKMEGIYIFERPYFNDQIEVQIPKFELWAPCKFN